MKNKRSLIYITCLCLIFLLMACSNKRNSSDNLDNLSNKSDDSSDKLDKDKIISTFKDFGYDEEDGETLYKEGENLDDGGIKIESSNGGIFIFDNKSDVIHVDALSTLKWDEDSEKDLEYPKEDYVKSIKDKYIPSDYTEEEIGYYTEDFKMYSFYKANPANIFNPHDQIRVVFNKDKNAIILYDKIDDFTIKEPPKIDEKGACNIAKNFLSESNEKEWGDVLNTSLTVIESNDFLNDPSIIGDSKKSIDVADTGVLHLAYVVEIEDLLIYVDAYNGDIIGGDSY
ncbi:hypothetical protein [Anaerococcus provencensis]|uniref:hypothetical protein n=1 Tax=Anaerococcus provencensis TaxID=938293 RepID=UPI0005CA68AC|nr:hypothetical protein [Anaerococcus provencensis]